MLSVGIVGLPNVGKSTLFNALTAGHAEVSNYPFTTIDANVGVVPVPDSRLAELEELLEPVKTTPCAIQFTDIAGLVEGASRGEGLGNQFLGEIRAVDAVAHVLRCFTDPDVAHVFADVDPQRDAEVIETELLLADLEVLERVVARRQRDWATHPRETEAERGRLGLYRSKLEEGVPLRALQLELDDLMELKGLGLLSGKPLLNVGNVGEDVDEAGRRGWEERLRQVGTGAEAVALTAKLEWELRQLPADERMDFMAELGLEESGLDRLVRTAFRLLGLVTFFTVVKSKLQAWEVPAGTPAPRAAGKVHSDMEAGFIRAQVVRLSDLRRHGSMAALRERGLVHTVGKEYEIADGDIVEFLF